MSQSFSPRRPGRVGVRLAIAGAIVAACGLAWPGVAAEPTVGAVVAIGGGSEQPALIKEVLDLAKGPQSRVAVLTTASSDPARSGQAYQRFFSALGVQNATVLPLLNREQAYQPAVLDGIAQADLIYVTGGNQLKLMQALQDTPAHGALLAAWQHGAVIAGTSAGAMVWGPEVVVAGESKAALAGSSGRQALETRSGLGLVPRLVVDTHFGRENRLGRLLVAAGRTPGLIGLGVDEGTAAVIAPAGLRVLGEGRVTVLDYAQAVRPRHAGPAFAVRNVQAHVLGAGEGLRWQRDEGDRRPMLPARSPGDGLQAAMWLQGGALPLEPQPAYFSQRPEEVLILAGEQADAVRWQRILQASGVQRTPVLRPDEIEPTVLEQALSRAAGLLLLEDGRWTLAQALSGESGRVLQSQAGRLSLAGAGQAVTLPGEAAQAGGGLVNAGLRLAPGMLSVPDWMAPGAFDRLVVDAMMAGGAVGVGLSADNGVRVADGSLAVAGASPVLLVQTDRVSMANPAVPSARDLLLHVLAPGESIKL